MNRVWVALIAGAVAAQTYRIDTFAGVYPLGDGGPAAAALLSNPQDLAFDQSGNVYVCDRNHNRVRRIAPTGLITTVAGVGTQGFSGDGGMATAAQLNLPIAIAIDNAGNLYIADSQNQRIRRVTPAGIITTFAGSGTPGFSGDGGPATAAQLNLNAGLHAGLAVDTAGNLYIGDTGNHRIRRVAPDGRISTYAGNGNPAFSGDGGQAAAAALAFPQGIGFDAAGNLYFADASNQRIRRVTPAGVISTLAGSTSTSGFGGDGGAATAARLSFPRDVAVDPAGVIYIADGSNNRIRRVSGGIISTLTSDVNFPCGLAVDAAGTLHVGDQFNDRVITVRDGAVQTLSGAAHFRGDGGQAAAAQFYFPNDIHLDPAGNMYVGDATNQRVRRIAPGGVVSTLAGTGVTGFSGDGGAATAANLAVPTAVFIDDSGNLFFADTNNNRIRRISAAGTI